MELDEELRRVSAILGRIKDLHIRKGQFLFYALGMDAVAEDQVIAARID